MALHETKLEPNDAQRLYRMQEAVKAEVFASTGIRISKNQAQAIINLLELAQ